MGTNKEIMNITFKENKPELTKYLNNTNFEDAQGGKEKNEYFFTSIAIINIAETSYLAVICEPFKKSNRI